MESNSADEFHVPRHADPFHGETAWFGFDIADLRLSGQFYPFFSQNLGVAAAGVYFWDDTGSFVHDILYAKNIWHLPLPSASLTDISLAGGLSYATLEPLSRYRIRYQDPDGEDVAADLRFTTLTSPHVLGHGHYDQPCSVQGSLRLFGQDITVDTVGFRDRSWGRRPQFGDAMVKGAADFGGYSYGTTPGGDGFHAMTQDFGDGANLVHGHLMSGGKWSKLVSGRRTVQSRDRRTGAPKTVVIEGRDGLGRALRAEGECLNQFGFFLNPNMFSINCLTRWRLGDGTQALGEDHENRTSKAARRFFRRPDETSAVGADDLR